jgi:hypothetical protein
MSSEVFCPRARDTSLLMTGNEPLIWTLVMMGGVVLIGLACVVCAL